MSQPPKPCSHCNNATFHVIPNMQVDIAVATTVLGMQAVQDIKTNWSVTLMICSQCGLTQTFTLNTAALAPHFAGTHTTGVPYR